MRVLVTGGSGLIGRSAVRTLLERGHEVTSLQRQIVASESTRLSCIQADITSVTARRAAANAEAVLHLAGRGDVLESWRSPARYLETVLKGTLNVLEGVRQGGSSVVFPSTQRVYRHSRRPLRESAPTAPVDPYALCKLAAEGLCRMYAQRYGVSAHVFRVFSVYGSGQRGQGNSGVVAIFREAAEAGQALRVDDGPRRDLTFVDDAVEGLLLGLESGRSGFRLYNLGTGVGTSLLELARMMVEATGSHSEIVGPATVWRGGDLVPDIARIRRELGFVPRVDLAEGLRRFVEGERQR